MSASQAAPTPTTQALSVVLGEHRVRALRIRPGLPPGAPPALGDSRPPPGEDPAPPAERPVLVFLHEALGNTALWRDFPAALCAATGCPGLVYDRLGFGGSSAAPAPRGPDYLHRDAELLAELLAALAIPAAIPIGHSDGGSIALLFAAARPDLARAVITEAAHVFVEAVTLAGIAAARAAFADGDLEARLAHYHGPRTAAIFQAWADTWQAPWFRAWDIRPDLAAVRCPVLALQGAADAYGSRAQLAAIAAAVAGPVSTHEIRGCGHLPHHQARRETLDLMTGFLTTLLPSS